MKFSTPKDTVYKKKWLPKPVASDRRAPQASVKPDHSECTCVCPAVSRLWTSKGEIKKNQNTAGSLTSGSERNSHFSPRGNQAKSTEERSRGSYGGQWSFSLAYYLFTSDLSALLNHDHLWSGNDPLKQSHLLWKPAREDDRIPWDVVLGHRHCGIFYIIEVRSRQDGSLSGRLVYSLPTACVSLSGSDLRICDLLNLKYHHAIQKQI